ncbi:MAG: replicative DNA helicase [Rhodobacteraceae bacterium]|nr:replicative DNA helicase [Paracoccaceae bacterium]
MPQNIEAEQQLLGAILFSNDVLDRVNDLITPAHFYDPVHADIFAAASSRIGRGLHTDAVTLKNAMADHPGLQELGGAEYLLRLQLAAVATSAARDYAHLLHDLGLRRGLIDLGGTIADRARAMRDGVPPDDQIMQAEADLFQLATSGTPTRRFQPFVRAMTDAVEMANAAYQRDGSLSGIATGLIDLDRILGGLHDSDLLILAGRPAMGKTALATNIAFNIARRGQAEGGGTVGMFSLEMSAAQLAGRVLAGAAQVPSDAIRKGNMTQAEFQRFLYAAQDLEACPLYIDDTPALPVSQLAARARRQKRTSEGLDVLIIDYLQLVRPNKARENRVNEVAEITAGLKALAKDLNIPVVALSQLSRQVESREDKRPQLADLRESGSIEQDADVVMFVFREEYYKEREKPAEHDLQATGQWQAAMESLHGKAEVIIGKQRHGPIGTAELSFDGRFTLFGNLAKPWQGTGDAQDFR